MVTPALPPTEAPAGEALMPALLSMLTGALGALTAGTTDWVVDVVVDVAVSTAASLAPVALEATLCFRCLVVLVTVVAAASVDIPADRSALAALAAKGRVRQVAKMDRPSVRLAKVVDDFMIKLRM